VLGQYFYDDEYIRKSEKMLINVGQDAFKGGAYYANWDILMAWFAGGSYEVAIAGKEFEAKRKEFDRHYLPNVILSGGKSEGTVPLLENKLIEGQTTIYVCQGRVCNYPVTEVEEALEQL